MKAVLAWFDRLVEQHKFFRRMTLSVVLGLIMWTTYQMFFDIEKISGPAATAYGIVTGLLAVAVKFYFDLRNQDKDKP